MKKGISAIVATVLIILITVAAVTIIWASIIPMIQNQIIGSTECFDASASLVVKADNSCVGDVDSGYCSDSFYSTQEECESSSATYDSGDPSFFSPTCTNPDWDPLTMDEGDCVALFNVWTSDVEVQVHRGTGNFELEGVEVIIGAGGTTQSVKFDKSSAEGIPDKNGDKVYTIPIASLEGITAESIDGVGVAAVITSGNTQKTCEKSGMVIIPSCS
jgi:flagellin-like protein